MSEFFAEATEIPRSWVSRALSVRTGSNRHRSFATRRLTYLHERRRFAVATPRRRYQHSRKCRDPILAHRWWPAEASRRTDLAAGLDAPLSLTDDPKRRGNRTTTENQHGDMSSRSLFGGYLLTGEFSALARAPKQVLSQKQ
jgi:hypothetical protein